MAAARFYAKGTPSLDELFQRLEGILMIEEGEDLSLPYPLDEEIGLPEEGLLLQVPIFILSEPWGGGAMGAHPSALEVRRILVREA